MREKIEKLAKGIFVKNPPDIILSDVFIEDFIKERGILCGSFTIDSSTEVPICGVVYSGSNHVILKEEQFHGIHVVIHYEIHALGVLAGEHLKGKIRIVSDVGERSVPYDITIEAPYIGTSMGHIRNMFHFTNLVKYNYEEALRVFSSPQFEEVFLSGSPLAQGIYNCLIRGSSLKTALEEFLIFARKKNRVMLTCSEEKKCYQNVQETHKDTIILKKDSWGYLEIEAMSEGEFIILQKSMFTTEEFAGNIYEFSYHIEEEKLHIGRNFGRILLKTPYQTFTCEVEACKKTENAIVERLLQKQNLLKLAEQYFAFRLHKLTTDAWCKQAMEVIEQMKKLYKEEPCFLKLFETQVLVAMKRPDYAAHLLHEVSEKLVEEKEEALDISLAAYYHYIRSLHARNSGVTKEAARQVREYYNGGYGDWRVVWVLLYLDEEHITNKSLRLSRLKEQYKKGCRSPFLYYEACVAINDQPALLRVMNEFEQQVLWWGLKNCFIREKTAMQAAELLLVERTNSSLIYRLLTGFYKMYHQKIVLEALLTMLIRNGKIQKKYFKWYEEGVKREIRITGLYEGYMNTLPQGFIAPLPRVIVLYFLYDNSLEEDRKAMLFSNIIRHEEEDPALVRSYLPAIERYTIEQLQKERISLELSILYKRIISEAILDEEMAAHYPVVLLMRQFICKDPSVRFVVVRHKEIDAEKKIPIVNQLAYFPIYTEDCAIVLEDDRGRRFYEHVPFELKQVMQEETLIHHCYRICEGDLNLWLHICEKEGIYGGRDHFGIRAFCKVAAYPKLKKYYRNQIEQKIIDYYLDNYDADSLEEYLRTLNKNEIEAQDCNKVIELMLVRGMYEEVEDLLKEQGYDTISSNRLMKYCIYQIAAHEEKESFLLGLCAFVFQNGKYNEIVLSYLLKYYEGSTKEMLKVWQAARDFEVEAHMMEERLLIQAMFSNTCLSGLTSVFDDYFRYDMGQTVIDAYLSQQSYLYFVCQILIPEHLFGYLEQRYQKQGLLLVEKLALLKYYSETSTCTKRQLELASRLMRELVENEYIFAFYLKFSDRMKLPMYLRDKCILEYETKESKKVELHYLLDIPSINRKCYTMEILQPMFENIYEKQFILFYGEKLQYYIAEEENGVSALTESDTLEAEDWQNRDGESRFGLLNSMAAAVEMHDNSTLKELADTYIERLYFAEKYGELL